MRLLPILSFAVLLTIFGSCKENKKTEPAPATSGDLRITFAIEKGGQPYSLNQVVSFDTVQSVRFDLLLFYLSNIELQRPTGEWVMGSEVEFMDIQGSADSLTVKVASGTYQAIRFGVGLDSTQNARDPNSYPLDHPLSSQNGMYWSWATKYRFIILEGRANMGSLDPNTDALLAYHPGADEFFRTYTFPSNIVISEGGNVPLQFKVELEDVFWGPNGSIDLINENQSHTDPGNYDIAERFILNFGSAIKLN